MTKISLQTVLFYIYVCFFTTQTTFAQEYNPKRFFNPLNSIETKQKNEFKTFYEFIQFNRKKKKNKKCNCPDDVKNNYRTNRFSLRRTIMRLISCNSKEFGNWAMHVHFSDGLDYYGTPFDEGDLNVGLQYFEGNLSYDLWLSAPIFDDESQTYGLRGGVSFFPIGSQRIFSPYIGTSLALEVDYNEEIIVDGFEFIENWYTEIFPLARLHAGVQYMFRCDLVVKMDVSYAAGAYFDRDGNQFPHYRPWVVWNTIGVRF